MEYFFKIIEMAEKVRHECMVKKLKFVWRKQPYQAQMFCPFFQKLSKKQPLIITTLKPQTHIKPYRDNWSSASNEKLSESTNFYSANIYLLKQAGFGVNFSFDTFLEFSTERLFYRQSKTIISAKTQKNQAESANIIELWAISHNEYWFKCCKLKFG